MSSRERAELEQRLSALTQSQVLELMLEWHSGRSLQDALVRHGLISPRIAELLRNEEAVTVPLLNDSAVLGASGLTTNMGRYCKVRAHARGGLGEVFVARDEEFQREVALKEIQEHAADDPASRARFVREAGVTGNLEHPGIVPVYGLGANERGRPWYAMRFLRGESLREAIQRHHAQKKEPLALRHLLGRLVGVCNAIAFAHSRGVIHRDIKPDNVMLGDYGETLVVDWGLAKVLSLKEESTLPSGWLSSLVGDETSTREGAAMGTPGYMPPEQARGLTQEVGPTGDIFALGATLYAILTGRAPYTGPDALIQAAACDWKPARQVKGDVPRALEAICARAMAKRPEDRYPTARDLADDVERWLADEPVRAHREPILDRVRRWGRRHRTLVTTGVAVLVLGVVGLTVGLGAVSAEQRRTAEARDEAIVARNEARDNERRAKKAEKEAKENLKVAEQNLKLARKAVNETLDLAKNHQLLQQPGMQEIRRLLLQKALPFYKQFRVIGGNEPKAQYELADQWFRLGTITDEIGNKTEAREAYEKAETILRALVKANLAPSEGQSSLAATLNNRGILLAAEGKRKEALAAYIQAREIRQSLVKANPAVTEYQNALARTLTNIGNLLNKEGTRTEALAAFIQARDILRNLVKNQPSVGDYRSDLGRTLNNVGVLLKAEGKTKEALGAYTEASDIQQNLVKDNPAVSRYRSDLARSLTNRALLRRAMKDHQAALPDLAQALRQVQSVLNSDPRFARAANLRWRILVIRALTLTDLGRHADAAADWGHFLMVAPPQFQASARVQRALCLARGGRADLAMQEMKSASKLPQVPPSFPYDLARVATICLGKIDPTQPLPRREHLAARYAPKALQWLNMAHKGGYFKTKANRDALFTDPDFAPLSAHPGFKAFLASLTGD